MESRPEVSYKQGHTDSVRDMELHYVDRRCIFGKALMKNQVSYNL